MRDEKKYLSEEALSHLSKSDYVFIANYERVTVPEVEELRTSLGVLDAEFHVVKNSALKHAAKERQLPDISEALTGPTAIVTGGESPAEVAKILIKFHKDKDEKCAIKVGVLGDRAMTAEEVNALSKLPSLEVLRGQLLGVLNAPASQMVRVMQAVPEGLLNVLQAKSKE